MSSSLLWLDWEFMVDPCDFYYRIIQGLYSLSGKTSYRQMAWGLEASRLGVIRIV